MSLRKWSDPQYLRHVQYKAPPTAPGAREPPSSLWTPAEPWFSWLAAQVTGPTPAKYWTLVAARVGSGSAPPANSRASLRLTLADLSAPMSTMAFARVSATEAFASVESLEADVQESAHSRATPSTLSSPIT